MVRLCITTYNRPAELVTCVDAGLRSDIELAGITVVDNSPAHYAQGLVGDRATVVTLPENIGFGPSINLFYAMYDDYIVYANDDVVVHPHSVRELVEHAERFPSYKLLYGNHDGEGMWSLFLLRKQAFLEAGPFDPAIWPLYYEDIDMLYRLRLLGYEPVTVHAATYGHIKNGTIKAFDVKRRILHERQFSRNEAYYRDKWGGLKFAETFTLPFNGGRPKVPPLITE
jgi:GT2 family glycosyltransferase